MAASDTVLQELHELVARAFVQKVKTRVVEVLGKDGEVHEQTVEPTAAELAAAITFLKNNNITAAPAEDGALSELAQLVEARRARRSRPVLPDFDAQGPLQ